MAASASEKPVSVRVLVDERRNRVVFVHAGKDFVDVLLSFLTLPMGTIARLVCKESNMKKVSLGSLSTLYESVVNLDEKHFWTDTCKEMMLQPRNSMERYIQNLKLNIDDTEKTRSFTCEICDYNLYGSDRRRALLSTFRSPRRCTCGKLMNREIFIDSYPPGFVPELATFVISDDLKVQPDDFQFSCLPMYLAGYEGLDAIKFVTVNVTRKEMLDILKCSLLSTTPLTDVFLLKKKFIENAQPRSVLDFDIGAVEAEGGSQTMKVKVMISKSNRKVLYAFAGEDFVDFILSFLTFPLGGVEHMLNGKSCLGSIDNLYKSVLDLDCYRYLKSPHLKHKLVNSLIAHQFKLRNQILPIDEVPTSGYSVEQFKILDPRSLTNEEYSKNGGKGFIKKPSMYMVTDDLVITPDPSISAISFLAKFGIPPSDLEGRLISIGKKEGLSLLKASLKSSSVLTNGLSQFLKLVKEENF